MTKMRSGCNTDPVAVGNRAAEAWAEADARAVMIAATSADGQAALSGAADAFTDKGKAAEAWAEAGAVVRGGECRRTSGARARGGRLHRRGVERQGAGD